MRDFLNSPVSGPMWTYYLLAFVGCVVGVAGAAAYYRARLAAKDETISLLVRISVEKAPAAIVAGLVAELRKRSAQMFGPNARLSDTLDTLP